MLVPGDIKDLFGNPVRVVKFDPNFIPIVSDIAGDHWMCDVNELKPLTVEQFEDPDYWKADRIQMGAVKPVSPNEWLDRPEGSDFGPEHDGDDPPPGVGV